MSKLLWQITYQIDGLIPAQVKLKGKIWLKQGEVLLEKRGDSLNVHLLHEGIGAFSSEDKVLPYLKFSPLLSNNAIRIAGGSGYAISSKKEFGKSTEGYLHAEVGISHADEAIDDIEKHAPQFLREIKRLHDKYIVVVNENKFLAVAIEFFYDANNKTVYTDEGFLSSVICLESLFNEGPSDISYKIAHRAAFLVGFGNANAVEAFQNLKKIYSDRSKLVHGAGTLDNDHNLVRYEVMRYARTSIMIFLILLKKSKRRKISKNKRKIEILKEVDFAMLDPIKREALKKEITRGLGDFKLRVPRTFEGEGKNGKYRTTVW